jgi:predicted metal-dependent TIM-barrel fold hydrolase
MDLIDSHLHAESLSWSNLIDMSMCGIRSAVTFPVCPWRAGIDTSTQMALISSLLRHETWRAAENNLHLFLGVGVPAVGVPSDVENFYEKMEELTKEPEVVAIGEVGFDPRSEVCKDIRMQGKVLRAQLEIAKRKKLPVVLHTPPDSAKSRIAVKKKYDKRMFLEKSLELVHEVGISPSRVVIDHLDKEEWIQMALDQGCYAGITIQEWRGVSPELAARWAEEFGPERILLNSDTSTLPSDHLGVPKTLFHLRRGKRGEKIIKKIVYDNPIQFYQLLLE